MIGRNAVALPPPLNRSVVSVPKTPRGVSYAAKAADDGFRRLHRFNVHILRTSVNMANVRMQQVAMRHG